MLGRAMIVAAFGSLLLSGPALGELSYVGSSALGENVIPEAARAFTARTGIPFGAVGIQGSGQGLDRVRRGQAQLAGVARSLTRAEKREPIYWEIVGYDAVAVYVHPTNPVAILTKQQLKEIYTGRIASWKALGGGDARIVVITQTWSAKRGQMVEFRDRIMDGAPYREDRREVDRQPDQIAALRTAPHGITAVSLALARAGIKPVAIEGFTPDPESVRSGAYILSRPLLLVTPARPAPEVRQFMDFMLSGEGQAIVARTFVPVR